MDSSIAFIGGGNMATALIGGLVASGTDPRSIQVVEPFEPQRERLWAEHGVFATPVADSAVARAGLVVWAVKPQVFAEAAAACGPGLTNALHLSVMAGVRSDTLARATGSERVVRAMPNTPALIGQGIAGLFAREAVSATDRALVEAVLRPTGTTLWVETEADLDAVTALSGSGPAYVLYLLEAMMAAGASMGLPADQARALALATVAGTAEMARRSAEPPEVLRAQVTSKGGTTAAAIGTLDRGAVKECFVEAMRNAQRRAVELGAD
ncbi:pyrroline-5-carboxylate reductase [Piscinibacter gummiphilus]|uniref:Pyrroline-5-carboxylate reductase n=1 Tax=Piscinibacter gummiphilus TaxID=946333 RepID=A0A1W6L692_9BURK|nr:pyrroline-5-carboxylate reductase [Piscinibacter gummiphilus]ARN19805.1 pyrroline-5-carboxylate reductase [Piscinibacter gummiphilus]ATU64475.1 pyrroline-5-carboxylate reductase [Piscinibacter gummiphilus]GLS95119.1 pyrroline-5-carboxylate reductase [Piscinibacter gummiphilus]